MQYKAPAGNAGAFRLAESVCTDKGTVSPCHRNTGICVYWSSFDSARYIIFLNIQITIV